MNSPGPSINWQGNQLSEFNRRSALSSHSFTLHSGGGSGTCSQVRALRTLLKAEIFIVLGELKGDGEGNGTPLQYSCLENPTDRGAWEAAVHGVAKSRTRLSDFTFPFHFHALEEEMATHSGVLAWRIPGTGKPGGLPSMGSHRVGHD